MSLIPKKGTVYVVDDDKGIRQALDALLRSGEWTKAVTATYSGAFQASNAIVASAPR